MVRRVRRRSGGLHGKADHRHGVRRRGGQNTAHLATLDAAHVGRPVADHTLGRLRHVSEDVDSLRATVVFEGEAGVAEGGVAEVALAAPDARVARGAALLVRGEGLADDGQDMLLLLAFGVCGDAARCAEVVVARLRHTNDGLR